jgi:hypothetical protein
MVGLTRGVAGTAVRVQIEGLCRMLGYTRGTILRQLNSNTGPEPHVISLDGKQWISDYISSNGAGQAYECLQTRT